LRGGDQVLQLEVIDDHEVLYLERVECEWPFRMQIDAGFCVPIHCTASGKLLLAYIGLRNRSKLIAGLQLPRFTKNIRRP
jgi:IclR family transcriptional regulator, acetate operon repressor